MLWFAEFTAIFGFSFAFPFLPVFLRTDLGIRGAPELAIWSGVVASASGFALAITSPIWGAVADRYGRKPMLIRAMLGGAVTVGLIGIAQSPGQVVALRFLQGATSGTVAAATALVATQTPRDRVGWALGVLSSSIAMGGAIGPLAGGLAAAAFGLRAVFVAGGVLLAISVVPVALMVKEAPRKAADGSSHPAMRTVREAGALKAIGFVLGGMLLVYTASGAAQQLFVLRMLELAGVSAAAVTGAAFGAAGLTQALAAATYSAAARRIGYLRLTITASAVISAAFVGAGLAESVPLEILAVAFYGLLLGTITPALSSMLGLETPSAVQARVFGFGASATALGLAFGPLMGGGVAAAVSVPAALVMTSAVSILLAVVLYTGGREPAR